MRGQVKFRIGRIVWLSLSRDGTMMGFAFPKELRNALVESDPVKFSLPSKSDMRYHWAHVRLEAIDEEEMRELVEDAWSFCVPKYVAEEYAVSQGSASPPPPAWRSASPSRAGDPRTRWRKARRGCSRAGS